MTLALSFYSRSGTWRCLRSLNASCLSNLIDTDVLGLFIYFDQIQNIFFSNFHLRFEIYGWYKYKNAGCGWFPPRVTFFDKIFPLIYFITQRKRQEEYKRYEMNSLLCFDHFNLTLSPKIATEQEAFGERRHLHVCDLWHVIVTFSLSQELLDYVIKCYPVDKYNFDLSLLILVYIPPVIFHVKFCEQLEACF